MNVGNARKSYVVKVTHNIPLKDCKISTLKSTGRINDKSLLSCIEMLIVQLVKLVGEIN
jgi:hypothetical protein